jgi:uncharacterized protein YkwD
MKKHFRLWFVPYKGNDYHPHILHTHRAIYFSSFFVGLKVLLFIIAIAIPAEVYLAPDILAKEEDAIISMTNEVRRREGLPVLLENDLLKRSTTMKTVDMASREYFAHENPDGRRLPDLLEDVGYSYTMAGENLAMGVATASDILQSWTKSPKHYANIVESNFTEQGVHIVSGMSSGWPVVYVAHHFGKPGSGSGGIVKSVKKGTEEAKSISLVSDKSFLDWGRMNNGTVIAAGVTVTGDVSSGRIVAGGQIIPLVKSGDNSWTGSIYIDEKPEQFFRPMIPARIEMRDEVGIVHSETLDWRTAFVPDGSAVGTYQLAQSMGPLEGVFTVSKYFYGLFVLFFSFALLINIFVEVKRQHFHIIGQTLSVIVLLVSLLIV